MGFKTYQIHTARPTEIVLHEIDGKLYHYQPKDGNSADRNADRNLFDYLMAQGSLELLPESATR